MRPLLLLLFASFSAASGLAQTGSQSSTSPGMQARLDERVPVWIKAYGVTGVAIAFEKGKLAWTAFYGQQTPDGPLANDKTLYSVASQTKPISDEIIVRLASQGTLALDEAISAYWTDPDVKDNPWN